MPFGEQCWRENEEMTMDRESTRVPTPAGSPEGAKGLTIPSRQAPCLFQGWEESQTSWDPRDKGAAGSDARSCSSQGIPGAGFAELKILSFFFFFF